MLRISAWELWNRSLIKIGDGRGDVALGIWLDYVGFLFLNSAITG